MKEIKNIKTRNINLIEKNVNNKILDIIFNIKKSIKKSIKNLYKID